jgi:hypothetical protein
VPQLSDFDRDKLAAIFSKQLGIVARRQVQACAMTAINPRLFVGDKFLARPDAWWPDKAVAVEVESKSWHLSPADWERTLARRALMAAEGIVVLPFPPSKLRTAKQQVAREIRAALENSRGPLVHISTRPVE